jgi:hypothetical protein
MLKVIVMIDCNICGQPFNRIVITGENDPMAWKSMSSALETEAESCG